MQVVLTDGRANPSTPSDAVREALLAKSLGITVFTIGLGEDLDFDALRDMASTPDAFYHSPTAQDLAAIYEGIPGRIPCPPETFWGGR